MIPVIGMGLTEICWSDRHPWTVIEVMSKTKIRIQKDAVKAKEGVKKMYHQEWDITADPNGRTEVVTLRRNGKWHTLRMPMTYTGFVLGKHFNHYDWSF